MPAPQIYIGSFLLTQKLHVLERSVNIPPGFHHTDFNNYSDLITFINRIPLSIIFVSAVTREDIVALSKLCVEIKNSPNQTKLVIMGNRHINVRKVAEKLGIKDVVDADVTPRSLRFKINAWVSSFRPQDSKSDDAETMLVASPKRIATQENSSLKNTPRLLPALDCPDDMWLLRSKFDCTFSLNKWFLKLLGPSPYVGRWVKRARGVWEFKFKEENNKFCSANGSWFFKGSHRPDYVWKDNYWLFASDQFELFYVTGDVKLVRASLRSRQMEITQNSEFAKEKHKLIVESNTSESSPENEEAFDDVDEIESAHIAKASREAFDDEEEKVTPTKKPQIGLEPEKVMKKAEQEFMDLIDTARSVKESEQTTEKLIVPLPSAPKLDQKLKDLLTKAAKQYKAGA